MRRALVGAVAAVALAGCAGTHLGPPAGIVQVGSSWITGESSLDALSPFAVIEKRAEALAGDRWAARQAEIAAIAAAKRAAALRRRDDLARERAALLRKYEAERARQLAAYRAKLAQIEAQRAAQEAKLAAEKRKYAQELAAYLRKRTVTPGQECQDPVVRRYYQCGNGLLPAGGH